MKCTLTGVDKVHPGWEGSRVPVPKLCTSRTYCLMTLMMVMLMIMLMKMMPMMMLFHC